MASLDPPRAPSASSAPTRPARASQPSAEVSYLPESVSFHLALTGRETLAFYARLKGLDARLFDPTFAVGIDGGAADCAVGTYSKSMRQRLGLAQALLGRPHVLIIDEPTSGFDPALRRKFYSIVAVRAAEGATVLLASHALTEPEGRADRMVIVNRGVKIADGGSETWVPAGKKLPLLARLLAAGRPRQLDCHRANARRPPRPLPPPQGCMMTATPRRASAPRPPLPMKPEAGAEHLPYGTAALAVGWNLGAAAWVAFTVMVAASVLLGAVFLALG